MTGEYEFGEPPTAYQTSSLFTEGWPVAKAHNAFDCEEIPTEFFPTPPATPYVKGFLVIESFKSLDVTAVYTAGTQVDPVTGAPSVRSIDVEQIKERRIK